MRARLVEAEQNGSIRIQSSHGPEASRAGIAPDDHWMLQVQKSGSGDNISFLFRVDPEGRLWHMQPTLMEVVWSFLERAESLHDSDLYHTGIDFRSWDLPSHLLRFTFHGSYTARQAHIDIRLAYDLQKHVITRDTKA